MKPLLAEVLDRIIFLLSKSSKMAKWLFSFMLFNVGIILRLTAILHPAFKDRLKEKDLYYEVILTPDEAAAGGLYPVTVPVMASCPVCSRSGFWEGLYCPLCDGLGRIKTEKKFALGIPSKVSDGTEISLSLEGIGLKDCFLHIRAQIADY